MSEVLTLKKRKDFVRVASKGAKMVTSSIILQAALSLSVEKTGPKVGYTTTKKIGKAHIRNRTRRRMRAAVRELFKDRALPNIEYVLIGRYNTADIAFETIKGDLCYGLKKIHKLLNLEGKSDESHPQKPSDSAN